MKNDLENKNSVHDISIIIVIKNVIIKLYNQMNIRIKKY